MNQSANILFLVSDPLDASISIRRDLLAMQDALRDIEAAAWFDVRVAEADAVQSYLARGARPRYDILHYLGHGYRPPGESGGFLIFEKKDGAADPLNQAKLSYVLADAAGEFRLAVISACHSESVAAAMFAAGAEHVVAIDGDQTVYEAAAVAFCKRFYQSLLTGRSLRDAFDSARRALFTDETMRALGDEKTKAEAAKFRLHSRPGADAAQFRLPVPEGQSRPEPMDALPALSEYPFDNQPREFIGRNPDMRDLLAALDAHRAAVVLGVSGVGKTELAKQTARRMVERRRVAPERVAFAALVNARSADEARAEITRAFGLKPGEAPDNGALQRAMPRHALLILDEAENTARHDFLAFRRLLDAIVTAPANPLVIVTSQTDPATPHAPALNVRRLADLDGFRLFAANANLTDEQFARMDRPSLVEVLGHLDRLPRAIELVARVWRRERGANPDSADLGGLLAQLRADRDRVMRDPDYPDEVKSVTVGVQYAYDRLLARSPEAARVWTYLALFPGGLPKLGLAAVFGLAEAAAEIERQSLAESVFGHLPPPFGDLLQLPSPFRFFALRHLPEGGEAAARAAIGESVMTYYFDFPDEAHRGWAGVLDASLQGSGDAMGLFIRRFSAELPSIEAWLDWACDHETPQGARSRAARLGAQLRNIHTMTDALLDQRPRFGRALAAARRCADHEGEANVLKALGDLQLRESDLAGARGSYESALPLYREIRARLGEANVLKALGDLQLRESDLAGARGSYESALPLYREIRARLGEANVLKALGDLQLREDDLAGARGSYESALPLYREIRDRLGEANVLKALGDLQLREDDLAGARGSYESALPLYREIRDRLGEANVLKALGDLQLREDDLAGARGSYESALPLYREIRDRLGEANVLKALGDLQLREDDLAGARGSYESALPLYREIRARLGEANVLQALGDLQLREDDLAGARGSYESALPLYREIRDRLGEANVLKALGDLQLRESDLAGARGSYESALPLYREIRARLGEANVLKALGDLQLRESDLAGARGSYESALPLYREIRDRLGEANVLQALGDLQLRESDLAGARGSYESALPLYREIRDRLGEANVLQMLGNLALAEGRTDVAFGNFRAALEIHSEIGSFLGVAACYGYMGRAAKSAGDHARAILLNEEAIAIFRKIVDRWGEGLALNSQGQSFLAMENAVAGLAAMWLARERMRASGNQQARQLDAIFEQFAASGDEATPLLDALPEQAEALRQTSITALRQALEAQTAEGPQE